MDILRLFRYQIFLFQQDKNSGKSQSGKQKTKSSKKKTSKSKLASKILSSKPGNTKSSDEDDEGRNTNTVVIQNGNAITDTVKDTLLKDLKDTDFVMETPSAAIFTLVVGMYIMLIEITMRFQ